MVKRITLILLFAAGAAIACQHGKTIHMRVMSRNIQGGEIWVQADIDQCIAPIIGALNRAGIATFSSCCNHEQGNGYIVLEDRILIVTSKTNRAAVSALYNREWEPIAREWEPKVITKDNL